MVLFEMHKNIPLRILFELSLQPAMFILFLLHRGFITTFYLSFYLSIGCLSPSFIFIFLELTSHYNLPKTFIVYNLFEFSFILKRGVNKAFWIRKGGGSFSLEPFNEQWRFLVLNFCGYKPTYRLKTPLQMNPTLIIS